MGESSARCIPTELKVIAMTATSPTLRWGIIGPGGIAQAFLRGLEGSRTGKLVAIGTRNAKKPGLAEKFPGARIVEGYEALLADPEVDAVYIARRRCRV